MMLDATNTNSISITLKAGSNTSVYTMNVESSINKSSNIELDRLFTLLPGDEIYLYNSSPTNSIILPSCSTNHISV